MKRTLKRMISFLAAAAVLITAFPALNASAKTVAKSQIQLPNSTAVITAFNADSEVEVGTTPDGYPCYYFYLPQNGSVIFDQQVYIYGYKDGALITQNVPANTTAAPQGSSVQFEVVVKKDGTLIKNVDEFVKATDLAVCIGIFVFGKKDLSNWADPTGKAELESFAPGKQAAAKTADGSAVGAVLPSAKIKLPGASSTVTLTNVKDQVGYQVVNGVTNYFFFLNDKSATVTFDQDVFILMQLDKEVGTWSAKANDKGIVYENTKAKYKDLILYASVMPNGKFTTTREEAGKAAKTATAVILFDSLSGVYETLPKLPISNFAP